MPPYLPAIQFWPWTYYATAENVAPKDHCCARATVVGTAVTIQNERATKFRNCNDDCSGPIVVACGSQFGNTQSQRLKWLANALILIEMCIKPLKAQLCDG